MESNGCVTWQKDRVPTPFLLRSGSLRVLLEQACQMLTTHGFYQNAVRNEHQNEVKDAMPELPHSIK